MAFAGYFSTHRPVCKLRLCDCAFARASLDKGSLPPFLAAQLWSGFYLASKRCWNVDHFRDAKHRLLVNWLPSP